MIQQLYHVGQHGDADNSFAPNWSPSGLPSYHDADGSHAMTEAEIHEVIDGFVASARRAQAAGFDGVEIFAAYHALVDQFWTPWSNRRTDDWGGVVRGAHALLGDDPRPDPRGVRRRLHHRPGGEHGRGLGRLPCRSPSLRRSSPGTTQRRAMDYVTCGTGSYFDFYPIIPVSLYEQQLGVPFAAELKRVVTHALVQAESHIRTPEAAESVLASGQADLVSIVRGQIADPHLVAKARADRAEDVRPCISCNQMCWGRRSRDYWISCLVNPSAGREFEWGGDRFTPAATARRVLVVGGGPAGLEAARVAAERGHRVTLLEQGSELGGQFRLAGRQPSRGQITDLLAWYGRRLEELGVDVRSRDRRDRRGGRRRGSGRGRARHRGATAADRVPASPPDRRSPARRGAPRCRVDPRRARWQGGSGRPCPRPRRPRGLARARNGAAPRRGRPRRHDHHLGRGRGWRSLPQRRGRPAPGPVLGGWRHDAAPDRGPRLGRRRAPPSARPLTGATERLAADTLVIAETPVAETSLASELTAAGVPFHEIGDCVAPRRASLAFFEGRELARRL